MSFYHKIKVGDKSVIDLRDVIELKNLPEYLLCPSGHRAKKFIVKTDYLSKAVPCYVCKDCLVVYRFHECSEISTANN